jgi:hypothetical protein
MRLPAGAPPRHDPKTLYAIQADRASGLSADEIATKHNLSRFAVQTVLRPTSSPAGMSSPYQFRHEGTPPNAAVQVYWLGYMSATGRIFGQSSQGTIVLAIHPQDEPHVQTLVQDLVTGHPRVEFADSNLEGRQAYVRDRQLAEVLAQWGISTTPGSSALALEFIPKEIIADFVRGYLEGSRLSPPFGGRRAALPSPASARSLTFVGGPALISALGPALHTLCGVRPGPAKPFGSSGLVKITLTSSESLKVLSAAYARPVRTSPRAARFAAKFAAGDADGSRRSPRRRSRLRTQP